MKLAESKHLLELRWHLSSRSISTLGCTRSIIMSHAALNYAALFLCKFKQLLRLWETFRKSNKDTAVITATFWRWSPAASIASALQQGANINSVDLREALYAPLFPYYPLSGPEAGTRLP